MWSFTSSVHYILSLVSVIELFFKWLMRPELVLLKRTIESINFGHLKI
jgi:hypothetical protein